METLQSVDLPAWAVNKYVTAGAGRARGKGSVRARSLAGGGQYVLIAASLFFRGFLELVKHEIADIFTKE